MFSCTRSLGDGVIIPLPETTGLFFPYPTPTPAPAQGEHREISKLCILTGGRDIKKGKLTGGGGRQGDKRTLVLFSYKEQIHIQYRSRYTCSVCVMNISLGRRLGRKSLKMLFSWAVMKSRETLTCTEIWGDLGGSNPAS